MKNIDHFINYFKKNRDYTLLRNTDVKKHVDDIAPKYIIPTETSDQAVMFVPAEAIFAELNAYHKETEPLI